MDLTEKISSRFVHAIDSQISSIKIFIIDDNISNQVMLQTYLYGNDYKEISSTTWDKANELFEQVNPDIVLAGVGTDKKKCMEQLKSLILEEDRKEIIIFADYPEIYLSLEALRLGVCDIITCPICPDDLDRSLDKAIKRLSYKTRHEHFLNQIDTVIREKTQQFLETESDFIPKKLIQGIIHNINGPLSVISGNAQLLEIGLDDVDMFLTQNKTAFQSSVYHELVKKIDRYSEYLVNILESGEKMKDIIANFLAKWRRDNSSIMEPFDVNEFIRLETEYLKADMRFKNQIKKHYDLTDGIPTINAVYSDFSQTFHNLVNNAIDAMHDSPVKELRISTSHDESTIYIQIRDTGCGIPADNIEKIFNPFFTTKPLKSDDSDTPIGSGIGLSNCVEVMKSYGATFKVESQPGAGTCITWQIPKHQPQQKQQPDHDKHEKRF